MGENTKTLADLGLYGLIDYFIEQNKTLDPSAALVDEDAFTLVKTAETISSTSLFLEGINFDLVYTPLQHLGYKAITASVNNILAMNAKPSQLALSLGISNKLTLQMLELLMRGVFEACKDYGITLSSFKPTTSLTGLTIATTLTGMPYATGSVTRSGANDTDVICVTGDLGGALLGLHLLEREKRVLKSNDVSQPDFGNNDYVLRRQLKPEARISIIAKLNELGIMPTAMTGISEGLATSLILMCRASKKGCRIYENKVPLNQASLKAAAELNFNPLIAALNGGEDYELLFTLPLKVYEAAADTLPQNITAIGYITEPEKACRMITATDDETDLKAPGWGKEYH